MDGSPNTDKHLDPVRLDALRSGGGTPEEQAHLAGCPACREALAELAALAATLRSARTPLPEVPPAVDEAIMAAWRDRHGRNVRWIPFGQRWLVPAIGTAAVITLALSLGLPRQNPIPTHPPLEGEESLLTSQRLSPSPFLPDSSPQSSSPSPVLSHPQSLIPNPESRSSSSTILDAFALARALRDGTPTAGKDVTGDSLVDRSDVDALARRAVALPG
jgi:anti-sigma factor RsiW